MSTRNFVKGSCRHCSGHLEFPADAAGETIACPHCGHATELIAPPSWDGLPSGKTVVSRKFPFKFGVAIAVALCLAAILAAGLFWHQKHARGSGGAAASTPSTSTNASAVSHPKPLYQNVRNDFAVLPFKLEKTPGSSLVYITGTIRNLSDHQRFGVKIEFSVFDASHNGAGTATDYEPEIDPHGDWHFKALVMESKAVSAKLNSILEDK